MCTEKGDFYNTKLDPQFPFGQEKHYSIFMIIQLDSTESYYNLDYKKIRRVLWLVSKTTFDYNENNKRSVL